MNLIFLGTPEFAVPTLDALVAAGHTVSLVVTQPDRPKGRKQELTPSPVKAAALRHGLPVFQPERIRNTPKRRLVCTNCNPEAMVVVGYGQIIPQSIIDLAPLGIINVHASLLPELRGAAPIQWSIARGYEKYRRHHHAHRCRSRYRRHPARMGNARSARTKPRPNSPRASPPREPICWSALWPICARAAIQPVPQDKSRATYAPILKKEDGRIDWTHPAQTIHNLDSRVSTLARSAHVVPRPVAAPLALPPGPAKAGNCRPERRHSERRRLRRGRRRRCSGITGSTTRRP